MGQQCGGGEGRARGGPAKLTAFFRLREHAARATGRGRGRGPGASGGRRGGAGAKTRRRSKNVESYYVSSSPFGSEKYVRRHNYYEGRIESERRTQKLLNINKRSNSRERQSRK